MPDQQKRDRLPLSALLSQVYVAFTIEFDNEFEHQVPHRTTDYGSSDRSAPWLVSMVMWLRLMRFVPDDGIGVTELRRLARLPENEFRTSLTRMSKWWSYLTISRSAGSGFVARPTPGGLKALHAWRPLTGIIESRWQKRYGNDTINALRDTMRVLVSRFEVELPDHLPILDHELLTRPPDLESAAQENPRSEKLSAATLPILLSKLLSAFAVEFERDPGLSLAISANVLRLASSEGVRVRDLPRITGVSKEAIALCVKRLEKRALAVVEPESSQSRLKSLMLTPSGQKAKAAYEPTAWQIERRWEGSLGRDHVEKLRQHLEAIVGTTNSASSPLYGGITPYPDGWRAAVKQPEQLPHFPMTLHRGGFPDGS